MVLLSCGEGDIEDNQDGDNGKGLYSDITKTDEGGHFISFDMDDWIDDGILEGCYAYPNPAEYYVNIQGKLLSSAYIVVLIS